MEFRFFSIIFLKLEYYKSQKLIDCSQSNSLLNLLHVCFDFNKLLSKIFTPFSNVLQQFQPIINKPLKIQPKIEIDKKQKLYKFHNIKKTQILVRDGLFERPSLIGLAKKKNIEYVLR